MGIKKGLTSIAKGVKKIAVGTIKNMATGNKRREEAFYKVVGKNLKKK
jgi:hypothetical protein